MTAPRPAPSPSVFCLWSDLRVARNLDGTPFPAALSPDRRDAVAARILDALPGRLAPASVPLVDASRPDALTPAQQRWLRTVGPLPSPGPVLPGATSPEARALFPANVSSCHVSPYAVLNGHDHLHLGAAGPGECLSALWQRVSAIDDALSLVLPYAFDPRWGYAVSDIWTAGSGLDFTCRLHLPLTDLLGLKPRLMDLLAALGFSLRATFSRLAPPVCLPDGEVSFGLDENFAFSPGSIHDLVPTSRAGCWRTAFRPEADALGDFSRVVRALAAHEVSLLARVRAHVPHILYERSVRAAARAAAATRLETTEALVLLSDLRLSHLLGYPGIATATRFHALAMTLPPHDPDDPETAKRARAACLRAVAPPLSAFPPPPDAPKPLSLRPRTSAPVPSTP